MSVTAYPTLRLKLTMPQALKLQFLPAIPGSNAALSAAAAKESADAATVAADAAAASAAGATAAVANKVDKAGDVMTGFLTLNNDPSAVLHAATKRYVDTQDTAVTAAALLRGYIDGLTLAWVSNTSFSVGAGQATNDAVTGLMNLAATITKTTSVWAVGSGNGGLDTGAIAANTWYHVFLVRRPDTGVVDVLYSVSATAPTLPASYTQKRRVGSIRTNASSQILSFTQRGERFFHTTSILDVNTTTLSTARVLFTLTVPTNTIAIMRTTTVNATAGGSVVLQPIFETDAGPSATAVPLISIRNSVANLADPTGYIEVPVDVNSQIAARAQLASTSLWIVTLGWIDERGRNA